MERTRTVTVTGPETLLGGAIMLVLSDTTYVADLPELISNKIKLRFSTIPIPMFLLFRDNGEGKDAALTVDYVKRLCDLSYELKEVEVRIIGECRLPPSSPRWRACSAAPTLALAPLACACGSVRSAARRACRGGARAPLGAYAGDSIVQRTAFPCRRGAALQHDQRRDGARASRAAPLRDDRAPTSPSLAPVFASHLALADTAGAGGASNTGASNKRALTRLASVVAAFAEDDA